MELVCLILIIMFPFNFVYASNPEVDALIAFKNGLDNHTNVLQSWDPTLVDPCTWFHVTCNSNNNVIRVDLGNAELEGPLVPDLGNLASLQYLEVFNNNINGSIPAELGNLTNLVSLDLYNNNLTGSIPQELGNLKNLIFLRINDNKLSGPIPQELDKLKNLESLRLNDNNLSGEVPFPSPLTILFPNITTWDFSGNPDLCGNHSFKPDCP